MMANNADRATVARWLRATDIPVFQDVADNLALPTGNLAGVGQWVSGYAAALRDADVDMVASACASIARNNLVVHGAGETVQTCAWIIGYRAALPVIRATGATLVDRDVTGATRAAVDAVVAAGVVVSAGVTH